MDKMMASVSMNSFNAQITNAMSFIIEKTKDSRTGFAFSFNTTANNRWTNMRLGFVVTDRKDIELGSSVFSGGQNKQLSYQLQKNWKHEERLQVVVFLTAFSGVSQSGSIGYLITQQSIQNKMLTISIWEEGQTKISRVSLDLVIFDPFNPDMRFQHKQLTDTFVSSILMGNLPPVLKLSLIHI